MTARVYDKQRGLKIVFSTGSVKVAIIVGVQVHGDNLKPEAARLREKPASDGLGRGGLRFRVGP